MRNGASRYFTLSFYIFFGFLYLFRRRDAEKAAGMD